MGTVYFSWGQNDQRILFRLMREHQHLLSLVDTVPVPDKIVVRLREPGQPGARVEYEYDNGSHDHVRIHYHPEGFAVFAGVISSVPDFSMKVIINTDDDKGYKVVESPKDRVALEWLRRREARFGGRQMDNTDYLEFLFVTAYMCMRFPESFEKVVKENGDVYLNTPKNLRQAVEDCLIQKKKEVLTKGWDTVTLDQKQYQKVQSILSDVTWFDRKPTLDQVPFERFCFRYVGPKDTMLYFYQVFADGIYVASESENFLSKRVWFMAKLTLCPPNPENKYYEAELLDSSKDPDVQRYLEAESFPGSGMTNFHWMVGTFWALSVFILDYSDAAMDVEEKVAKTPQDLAKKAPHKPGKSVVRLFKCYTLKKNWVSRVNRKKAEIKCLAWGVRGHYRHYRDGRVIFIQPYVKGKDRSQYKGKEYALLPYNAGKSAEEAAAKEGEAS